MRVCLPLLLCVSCRPAGVYPVAGGEYHVVEPPGASEGRPVLVMLHGYRGAPTAFTESEATVAAAAAAGVLLVAPVGAQQSWSAAHSPQDGVRDDLTFLSAVLDDVHARWAPSKTWMGGSSQGAAMAEDYAAIYGERLDGLVALSGGFWEPLPTACPSMAPPVTHSHGEGDTTWPLTGRTLYATYTQGAIGDDIAYWRACAGCSDAYTEEVDGVLSCMVWSDCASGGPVRFCLHDGGHGRPAGWAERQLRWLQSLE